MFLQKTTVCIIIFCKVIFTGCSAVSLSRQLSDRTNIIDIYGETILFEREYNDTNKLYINNSRAFYDALELSLYNSQLYDLEVTYTKRRGGGSAFDYRYSLTDDELEPVRIDSVATAIINSVDNIDAGNSIIFMTPNDNEKVIYGEVFSLASYDNYQDVFVVRVYRVVRDRLLSVYATGFIDNIFDGDFNFLEYTLQSRTAGLEVQARYDYTRK